MDKILNIAGKEVGLRATALTPRLYRHKIGRDIIQDMAKLQKPFPKRPNCPRMPPRRSARRPSSR